MPEDSPPPSLPVVVPATVALPVVHEPPLSRLERDYVMLAILVRIQHQRHPEAMLLVDALLTMGQRTPEVLLAKAVIESGMQRHEAVLETIRDLDRMDPPEFHSGATIDERVRARSFMKARAGFGLTGNLDDEGRASLDFYLRQGRQRDKKRR